MKKNVIVIAGPTASGKSSVAYYMAMRINGEIVNCDSIQLYKHMDIGSAKPSEEMMSVIPHHLFSIVDPDYEMSVADYQKRAFAAIDDILSRGKVPIVVGGTGLYINSILYKMDFGGTRDNGERRAELEELAKENGAAYMHDYLSAIDPESAARIHPNNVRKVIRAIEAYELGDGIKSMDELKKNKDYDFHFCVLNMDREWLYDRINQRTDKLIQQGLVSEVSMLRKMGYTADMPSMKGIGYKEVYEYLENSSEDIDAMIDQIKKDTRHYAKRQITWFKRYDDAVWLDIPKDSSIGDIVDMAFDAFNAQ